MREIRSGDVILRIRASSLAIFFYKQEFKTDILKDISEILQSWMGNEKLAEAAQQDSSDDKLASQVNLLEVIPDGYKVMQITWAMNKAQNVAEKLQTPKFEDWVAGNQDISVLEIFQDVLEEAMQGFFRSAPAKGITNN